MENTRQRAVMNAALATAFASAALEFVQTPEAYPAFAAWLSAQPDAVELTQDQLHGAEMLVTAISCGLFDLGPGSLEEFLKAGGLP
jgi:hypothetical protein